MMKLEEEEPKWKECKKVDGVTDFWWKIYSYPLSLKII